jgi:carboxymethylenebutenolidase
MTIHVSDIEVDGLQAYVAIPSAASAAVLFLPSVGGLDAFSRDRAKDLAEAGFIALVWHPYSGQPPVGTLQNALQRSQTLTDQHALDEMARWLDYLHGELGASTVGVLGFCMGGRYSLLLSAHDPRIASCVAFYPSIYEPRLPNQDEDAVSIAADIRCPVALLYPGRDHVMSAVSFEKLQANLQSRDHPSTVQKYPTANHAFMNHVGAANESASQMAWPQVIAFLKGTLAPVKMAVGTAPGV